ncbi:Hypothetical predicted protein [Mytilus galloprovincialis]|uniref:DZIP3-like HEPN domain-containing protein n=1 Tax=Mytilus galloprovincialis TaxID=29158 RepID=A0A8B6FK06_MYTGA|nr:Hypothetical predicted protein [Mytilus galloprovincialis]
MSLSKEESNFLRFYFLNLKFATQAVRVHFDSIHPPSGLANELATSNVRLKGLRFITKSQLQILYPNPVSNVTSDQLDSTLIICLLRNITPREYGPVTGWDNLPIPQDTSTGADLARVKWYRNMLAHQVDGKLSLTDFNQYWIDLEGVISRLGGQSLLTESSNHIFLDTYILSTLSVSKKTLHSTDDISNDTTSIIEEDYREGTFVTTVASQVGLSLLSHNGVLLITGRAGTGKSRISRHILHRFCTENTSYKYIKVNTLQELEDIVNRQDTVAILLDDIFGETNCVYDKEKDTQILDKVYAYVCKGHIKVIVTLRDTVKRHCQTVFDSHRLFKFDFVDLSEDRFQLSTLEKKNLLTIYMKTVRQLDLVHHKGFVDHNDVTIVESSKISKITQQNPLGFPLAVYQFVHNENYFQLGYEFFDRPTETILKEINEIRRKGEDDKGFMLQYAVMVFTAINENRINPDDNSNVTEIKNIIDAIYGKTVAMKKWHILDAVMDLKGSFLVKQPNTRSYKFHHPILMESVILSFAQVDDETMKKIIPLLSWAFFTRMVKPNAYKEKEGEVVLRIPTSSYKLLADRLVEIYIAEFRMSIYGHGVYNFLVAISNTEIFQQDDCVLLAYLLDAIEKTDQKYDFTENMIRCKEMNMFLLYMKNTHVFLAVLLVLLAATESSSEIFQFVLQKIHKIIDTDSNYFVTDYIQAALVTSLYKMSSRNDVKSVEHFESLLNIVDERHIPVLLDQNINFTKIKLPEIKLSMKDYYDSDISEIEDNMPSFSHFLPELSAMMHLKQSLDFYGPYLSEISSLSHKSLKWMIEKFSDQKLYIIDELFRNSCGFHTFDTVGYLAQIYDKFDAVFCLKIFLGLGEEPNYGIQFIDRLGDSRCHKDMFNFLFSKIDSSTTDLIPFVNLLLKEYYVPDCVLDAFLPAFISDKDILMLACKNANVNFAIKIIENGTNIDFQSAISACIGTTTSMGSCEHDIIEHKPLKIVKYIIQKLENKQFDMQVVYHQVIQWFVQNIDFTLLKDDCVKNSVLQESELEILDDAINKTELTNFEKTNILKSLTLFTAECSVKVLKIFSAVWDGISDKTGLAMEEIVIAAFTADCFNVLIWINENWSEYLYTKARKLLLMACINGRLEVATWILQAFESLCLCNDGGTIIFIVACEQMLNSNSKKLERTKIVNLIIEHFQISPLDLKPKLFRLISKIGRFDKPDLVVSIFEKCFDYLSSHDVEIMMNKSLDQKCYFLVNLLLRRVTIFSFDKQDILDKACADAESETIELLSDGFSYLDMNNALINACTSSCSVFDLLVTNKPLKAQVSCLDLLWDKINNESIDISIYKVVKTVCEKEYTSDSVMTWILKTFTHNQIPIKEVVNSCCKQRKLYHVQYIFHEFNNKQLDIKKVFCDTCRGISTCHRSKHEDVMLVDFLFQRLRDKTSSVSAIRKKMLKNKSYDLILYFLKKGYYKDIDFEILMNQTCRVGHVKLVHWILSNVQHQNIDIKSAFVEACKCKIVKLQMQCVVLMWHYVQDKHLFEIDKVLQNIKHVSCGFTYSDDFMNWLKYIKAMLSEQYI